MTRRATRWAFALIIALALTGALIVLRQPELSRRTADFTIGYSAGRLIRAGQVSAVYDQARLGAMMRSVSGNAPVDPRLPFNQPLAAAAPFVLLSVLPVDLAFRVWQLGSIALMFIAFLVLQRRAALGTKGPAFAWLALVASAPAWATLTEGQVTPLLLLGAALLIRGRAADGWGLSVVGGALLAIKPQYVPAYLLVLLAARQWGSLAAGGMGAVAVLLSPMAAGGPSGMLAMVRNMFAGDQLVPLRLSESWVGVVAQVVSPRAASMIGITLFGGVTAALLLLAWRKLASPYAIATLAGWLAILASPHSLPHDMILLAVPGWLAFGLYREGLLPLPVAGLLLTNLAVLVDLHGLPLVTAPLVMTAVGAWYAGQFRRRLAGRAAATMLAA